MHNCRSRADGDLLRYELMKKAPNLKVLLVDRGNDIYNRQCPILQKKINKCPTDKNGHKWLPPSCSITTGFGGAGAFSDGKYNITSEYGGWMGEYLDSSLLLELIKYVDQVNLEHGADSEITDPNTDAVKAIERKAIGAGLKLLRARVRHLGTEKNLKIMKNIYETMKGSVDYLFQTKIVNVIVKGKAVGVEAENGDRIHAEAVVLGVGREGAMWLQKTLESHDIEFINNQVDIGVRVETNNIVMLKTSPITFTKGNSFSIPAPAQRLGHFVQTRAAMLLSKTRTVWSW